MVLTIGLLACMVQAVAQTESDTEKQGVQFIMEDWQAAVEKAEAEGKYILLDAYTEWCYWCKVQDKSTFADANMAAYIHENFIPVKVDMEKGIGIELAAKFRVRSFPTLLFFNPQGQYIYNIVGYVEDLDKFKGELKAALAVEEDRIYAYDSRVLNPGFPVWYVNNFDPKKRRESPVEKETYLSFLDEQEDLYSEVSWAVMATFRLNEKYNNFLLENKDEYVERYGESEVSDAISSIIRSMAAEAGTNKDKSLLERALDLADQHLGESAAFMKSFMESNFYKSVGDWRGYTQVAKRMMEDMGTEGAAGMLNTVGWTLYLECDDMECLNMAAEWMKEVSETLPSYAFIDTYAALLFKTGQLAEAKNQAEHAISVGNEKGEDVSGTEDLLSEITAAMAEGD